VPAVNRFVVYLERDLMMRTLCTVIVSAFIVIVATVLADVHFLLGATFFVVLSWLFIENGIVYVPANPPHKAILVILGKRQKVVLSEGLNWLPLRPFIFDLILIKVEKVNYDLEPQEVRTPDNALLDVKASITWIAGIEDSPESFTMYLNSGGLEGVKKILHDIIEDRVKTWARSNKEGPSNWMEAQATKDDAHEVLVKAIMRDNLNPVGSDVPTSTWMRFFDAPQSEPTAYDVKSGWAEKDLVADKWNWNKLQAYYNGLLAASPNPDFIKPGKTLPASEGERIKVAIKERKEIVRNIREGKGKFGNHSLGITIVMFVINEIKVKGAVADAADQEEKERRERAADKVEIDNFSQRATSLINAHPGLSSEQAFDVTQVILGKVSKKIVQVVGAQTGLGQDVLGALSLGSLGGVSNNPSGSEKANQPKGGKDQNSEESSGVDWDKTVKDLEDQAQE